jgi:hypothetical protein
MLLRRVAIGLTAVALATIGLAPAADASSPHLADLVGQGAVAWTPNVSAGTAIGQSACNSTWFGSGGNACQSEVYDTATVNGEVIAVGAFTEVCQPGTLAQGLCKPGTQVTRDDIFAYQAGTGVIDPNFAPQMNQGPIWAVVPGPAGTNTVYVGGTFTTVNGTTHKGLVQLRVDPGNSDDGAIVTGFKSNVSNQVRDLALSPDGTALYVGGQFASVNSTAATGLVRVSAKTGAVDPAFKFTLSDPIAGLPVKVEAMDLTSDGSLLAVSGTALQVNGQPRPRLAVISTGKTLGGSSALTDFTAPILNNNCSAEHDYVRALSFAPDGSFLIVANTGYLNDGSMPFSVCDAVARFNVGSAASTTTGTPVNVAPSWINYAGGDSFYSVSIAGGVVYAGGHNRWVNNYCGADWLCEQNALYQGGLDAFDANTGIGLAWWHPITLRGAGTMYMSTFGTNGPDPHHSGLAVGMDVDVIDGQYHAENALLPVGGATTSTPFGTIPSGLFNEEGGQNTGVPMCVDDPADSLTSGTAVDLANCLNEAGQNWTVPAAGKTGPITINNLCLDTASEQTTGGTGLVLSTCVNKAPTQQWSQGAGNTVINAGATTNQNTPMCLDDPGSSTTSGTGLDIAACSGGANQVWPLPAAPGPAAGAPQGPIFPQLIQSDTQQPCLDDAGDSLATGNKVQMWTCRGDASQTWLAEPGGTIQIGASNCLDTALGGSAQGTQVVLNPCNGSSSQTWTPGPNDSLVQQSSGLCLDDYGANPANGNEIVTWSCNGGNNQAWRLPGW